MRTLIVSTWTFTLLLAGAAGVRGQEDAARAVIERAVQAHGGRERLARNRAARVRFKGALYLRGQPVPFTADTIVQMPSQYKPLIEMTEGGTRHNLVHIMSGDKVYVTVDSEPKKVDPAT